MYVFGGCTSGNTTFNDLWTFNLERRCWIRPLISGSHPPPKACASLVRYKRKLILFGGWTHSAPYPLDHLWKLFNQMHEFDLEHNRWVCVTPTGECPPMAGHCATVIADRMLVFGGLCGSVGTYNNYEAINDLWLFDFKTYEWSKKRTYGDSPPPRYGHSQLLLDDRHLLVMGGCSGPNVPLNDIWMLRMADVGWQWQKIQVQGKDTHNFPLFGFNPMVRIENTLIFLTKSGDKFAFTNQLKRLGPRHRASLEANRSAQLLNNSEQNVRAAAAAAAATVAAMASGNGAARLHPQPTLAERKQHLLSGSPGNGSRSPNLPSNKAANLAEVNTNHSDWGKNSQVCAAIHLNTIRNEFSFRPQNPMQLHLLDITEIREQGVMNWLSQTRKLDGPEELLHYSLVAATNELIMFGGVEKAFPAPLNDCSPDVVSNSVYIASAKLNVI
jgi:F-box protein 42